MRKKILKTKRLSFIMVLFSDIQQITVFCRNIKPYTDPIYNSVLSFCILLFKYYIHIYTHIQQTYNHLYGEYPYFTLAMDELSFYNKLFYSWIGNYHIEPNEKGWVLSHFLMEDKTVINNKCYEHCLEKVSSYLCKELQYLPPKCLEDVATKYDNTINAIKSITYGSNKVQEGLLIMKLYDKYIYRSVFHGISLSIDPSLPIDPCKNYFINVEYRHPTLTHAISIELTNMYLVNNIVLSPLFLHYVLSLQPLPYIIDQDYTINIMDQDINMVTLTHQNYILFDNDKYHVKQWKNIGKNMDSDESDSNNSDMRSGTPHPEDLSD